MAVSLEAAEVTPGRGLGPILFGTRPEVVERLLGEARQTSFTRDGDCSYIQLDYSCGVTFYFSVEDGERLDSFKVDSKSRVQLFGEPLFPRTKGEVLALLHRVLSDGNLKTIRIDRNEDIGEIMIKVDVLRAEFYFGLDENLQSVHCGVFFDEEDAILWPDPTGIGASGGRSVQ